MFYVVDVHVFLLGVLGNQVTGRKTHECLALVTVFPPCMCQLTFGFSS